MKMRKIHVYKIVIKKSRDTSMKTKKIYNV